MITDFLIDLLAFAPPPSSDNPAQAKQSMFVQIGMMVVLMVIFWVLLIRPQQKRAREQAELSKALKPGDKVATTSGIIGIVVSVKEHTLTLRSAEAKIEVTKSAIQERLAEKESSSPAETKA